ncbi:MAG: molybdopterin-dependent oxidoreductase [Nitrososphaeria archaeon]|jgi:DMSO/TMAO reductase YedYZ molybdopterin-dependent catalytic subunit
MQRNVSVKRLPFLLVIIVIVAAAAILGYYTTVGSTTKLNTSEITDYQGQKLSSISDEPEVSIKGTQYINQSTYRLVVTGLVDKNLTLTYDEVISRYTAYEKVVTLNCVEGWSVTMLWQGFLIKDLLADAGVKSNATIVIFYGYDNYSDSLPIDYINSNNIMIAYKMNNVTISPENGWPFQVVAEGKWGYKWVKWITKIEVSNNTDFKGYWEQNGYSINGDSNQSYIASP